MRFLGHGSHAHPVPHVVYVASGAATVTVDEDPVTLRAREAIWLAPDVPHAVRVRHAGMVLGPMLEPDVVPAGRAQALGELPALVDIMTTVLGAGPSTVQQIMPFRLAIGALLRRIGRSHFPLRLPEHPTARSLASDAIDSDGTLEELSRRHHLSSRQVQRIFLEETGLTFTRWRSRARMNRGIAYLHGGGDLSEAAHIAGYRTRAGLLRALSRETGIDSDLLAADPAAALARHGAR